MSTVITAYNITAKDLEKLPFDVKLSASGHDWTTWQRYFQMKLESLGLWDSALKVPIVPPKDYALALLMNSVHPDLFIICNTSTDNSATTYSKLFKRFGTKSIGLGLRAFKDLINFRPSASATLADLDKACSLIRKIIESLGDLPMEHICSIILLYNLPSSLTSFKDSQTAALDNSADASSLATLMDAIQMASRTQANTHDPPHTLKTYAAFSAAPGACDHFFDSSRCWKCHPELKPSCPKCTEAGHRKTEHLEGSRVCQFKKPRF